MGNKIVVHQLGITRQVATCQDCEFKKEAAGLDNVFDEEVKSHARKNKHRVAMAVEHSYVYQYEGTDYEN